jgi:hypothetical protein
MGVATRTLQLDAADRARILDLAVRHGLFNVRVFGSVARGEAGPNSDIDLLVDVESNRTYLDVVAFWQAVQELLGQRVDVLTDGGLSPYLRARIGAEAVAL